MNPGAAVRIVEVGPRDGLQNEAVTLAPQLRREFIERLAATGLQEVEAGSFVSPQAVPQMAGTANVLAGLARRAGVRYTVLTPNLRGFEDAMAAGADRVAVFAAASESFSQKNIRCSIAASLQRYGAVLDAARRRAIPVRGYVSCVVVCPYEGPVEPAAVADVAAALFDLGCEEISLGDTIGAATPPAVLAMLGAVARRVPVERLAGHFHDTYGRAIDNARASHGFGLRVFDGSVAGLGGCPYAPGARGNVDTLRLLDLFEGLGIETGIDRQALAGCGAWILGKLGRAPGLEESPVLSP